MESLRTIPKYLHVVLWIIIYNQISNFNNFINTPMLNFYNNNLTLFNNA